MRRLLGAAVLLCCLAGLSAACAPVMFEGEQVAIASESALIVYDEKTKTEHFIRKGAFDTKVPYFGFLVPTPSVPTIAEVPDDVFDLLADWTKPKVVTQTVKVKRERHPTKGEKMALADKDAPPRAGVDVLGRGSVAGLDYVILKGDTTKDLKEWLDKHNYVTRPDLETWLAGYVKAGWILTAFQMAKPKEAEAAAGLKSRAVRMSFQTDKPFYPYLEPEGQREPGAFQPNRLLRVFYVGTKRVQGKLGEKPWQGQTRWSKPLEDGQRTSLTAKLDDKKENPPALPEGAWLTEFEDHASPRPGGSDLFFGPSPHQAEVEREPIVHYHYVYEDDPVDEVMSSRLGVPIVIALVVIVLGALGFVLWRMLGQREVK